MEDIPILPSQLLLTRVVKLVVIIELGIYDRQGLEKDKYLPLPSEMIRVKGQTEDKPRFWKTIALTPHHPEMSIVRKHAQIVSAFLSTKDVMLFKKFSRKRRPQRNTSSGSPPIKQSLKFLEHHFYCFYHKIYLLVSAAHKNV